MYSEKSTGKRNIKTCKGLIIYLCREINLKWKIQKSEPLKKLKFQIIAIVILKPKRLFLAWQTSRLEPFIRWQKVRLENLKHKNFNTDTLGKLDQWVNRLVVIGYTWQSLE